MKVLTAERMLMDLLNEPPVPEVGLHEDVSWERYFAWDACSHSALTAMEKSPAHCWSWKHAGPDAGDTPEKILGRALHAAIFEPDRFDDTYICGPEGNWNRKAQRDALDELRETYPGAVILKPEGYASCMGLRESARTSEAVQFALGGASMEITAVWRDEATGQLCKARADALNRERGLTVDLKSTGDAREDAFRKAIYDYRYYRQGAFYTDGFTALDIPIRRHVVLAYEKEPPYSIMAYPLDLVDIELGRTEYRPLLQRYAECSRTNHWPGYPDGFHDLALNEYQREQIQKRTLL